MLRIINAIVKLFISLRALCRKFYCRIKCSLCHSRNCASKNWNVLSCVFKTLAQKHGTFKHFCLPLVYLAFSKHLVILINFFVNAGNFVINFLQFFYLTRNFLIFITCLVIFTFHLFQFFELVLKPIPALRFYPVPAFFFCGINELFLLLISVFPDTFFQLIYESVRLIIHIFDKFLFFFYCFKLFSQTVNAPVAALRLVLNEIFSYF